MKTKPTKPSGRPRRNTSDTDVITSRPKLLTLQNMIVELLTEYEIGNNDLAKWTLGSERSGYLSDLHHGRHLGPHPKIKPRESDYKAIRRFLDYVRTQETISAEIHALMLDRFELQAQMTQTDTKIFRALKRLALK